MFINVLTKTFLSKSLFRGKTTIAKFLREKFSKSFHYISVNISRNEPVFIRPFA